MDRLFCAIDTGDLEAARALTTSLVGIVGGVKFGSTFVVQNGLGGVATIADIGLPVMLDLKLLEIPREVGNVVRASSTTGAFLITVHALGGGQMMRSAMGAALRAADVSGSPRMKILGVTLLTNMGDGDLGALGMSGELSDQVKRLADLAQSCGLDGVWTSAHDLTALRSQCGPDFLLVVPGIRPVWSNTDDQTRISTPGDALHGGADYLVVGRPITQADDPPSAAARIAEEMTAAIG
jgi:orotidine-5'-phosphate decarboxylase